MKFSLEGQLRGPECRRVMIQAIALRKVLETWFGSRDSADVRKIVIVLRVDGSLGSFGPEGVENIEFVEKNLTCDLVVADRGWAELSDTEIGELLRPRVLDAIALCFEHHAIPYDRKALDELVGAS